MSQVETEIAEQPGALARLLKEGRAGAEETAARVRAYGPRYVVIAARGTSDNAARYAQYLLGAANGLIFAGALFGGATVPKAIGNLSQGSSVQRSMMLLVPLCLLLAALVLALGML